MIISKIGIKSRSTESNYSHKDNLFKKLTRERHSWAEGERVRERVEEMWDAGIPSSVLAIRPNP